MVTVRDRPPRLLLRRHPDLARLWAGHSLSMLGSHLSTLALPLLVLDTTGSAALAGLVGTVRMLTYLATTLHAGALADRLPRRGVLVAADLVRAVAVLVVGVALWSGHTPAVAVLLVVGAVDTAVTAAAGPAGTAVLRHLVPADDLTRALALDGNRRLTLALVGPLAGGVLYQWAPSLPFLLDGLSYGASLLLVLSVRRPLGGGGATASTLREDVVAGVRYVVGSPFLLSYLVWAAVLNFATGGMTFGLVVLIGAETPGGLGVAMTVLTLAGLAGTSLAPRMAGWGLRRLVRLSTASAVLVAVGSALVPHAVVVVALVAARSLVAPAAAIVFGTRVFAEVPDGMTARVQSSLFLVGGAFTPFASLVSGWLCERWAPAAAFAVFAGVLGLTLVATLLPGVRPCPAPMGGAA